VVAVAEKGLEDDISGVGMAPVLRYEGPETMDGYQSRNLLGKKEKPMISISFCPRMISASTFFCTNDDGTSIFKGA